MSDFKNRLKHVFDELKALEERARKLKNQNLADIAASAHGRVKQLSDHPDLDLVDEKKDQTVHPDGTLVAGAFDPKAPTTKEEAIDRMHDDIRGDPEAAARARWPHLFEPAPFSPDAPQPGTMQQF